jgi:hypothetical protein
MGLCGDCLTHISSWPVEKETLRERGREEQLQILQGRRETAYVERSIEMLVEWGDELWRLHQAGLPDAVARVAAVLPDHPAGAALTLEAARDVIAREVVGGVESWSEYVKVIDAVRTRRKPAHAEEQIAKWKEEEGIRFLSAERYAYEAPVGHDVYTAFQHYVDGELFEDTRKAFRREDGWREQLLRVGESWGDDGHSFFLYFDQATGGRSFPTLNREQRAWRSIAAEIPIGEMTPVFVLVANAETASRIDDLTVDEIIAANELVVVACVEIQLLV